MSRIQFRASIQGTFAVLLLAAVSFAAKAADPIKLESIDVQTLSGQQVQLKLHMSGPAPSRCRLRSTSRRVSPSICPTRPWRCRRVAST